ncbi:MAG TPA: hypothetical protein EYH05_09585 [Anaerolineae bacterium]|nr:hypothetical protein [Anaerolineae bacterium]
MFSAIAAYFSDGRSVLTDTDSLPQVYAVFDEYSQSHKLLRQAGVTSGEVSRANQSLRAMMIEFEKMHNVGRYRTPVALRAYSQDQLENPYDGVGPDDLHLGIGDLYMDVVERP